MVKLLGLEMKVDSNKCASFHIYCIWFFSQWNRKVFWFTCMENKE